MTTRAFTTYGVGRDAASAHAFAVAQGGPVAGTSRVVEVEVPATANPSKVATWIQRVAQDADAIADVPGDQQVLVRDAAARMNEAGVCLAIRMSGDVGERMKARLGGADGDAYLLFGIGPHIT